MALGIEESGLHKRAALKILMLKFLRTRKWGIMLGFMAVTAFLSMWVSNTATVAMMIPIVDAVCESLFRDKMDHRTRNMLLLSVAYAANIGGTGVMTGNALAKTVFTNHFECYEFKCNAFERNAFERNNL